MAEKIKNILLIGNGFDLYHGLPTRYMDFLDFVKYWEKFYQSYKNPEQDSEEAENEWGLLISLDNGRLTEESMKDFAKYKDVYSEEDIEKFNDCYKENKWIAYFIAVKKEMGENWIDFEQEMQNALQYIEDYFTKVSSIAGTGKNIDEVISSEMKKVIESFAKGNLLISGWIGNNELSDIKKQKPKLLENMKNELDKLIVCLWVYLGEFVGRIAPKVYSEQIADLDVDYVLNFNYTDIYMCWYIVQFGFDRARMVADNYNIHDIHGSAIGNNLVLGISDEAFSKPKEESPKTEYIYFQKYFQRIQKRTGNKYREWIVPSVDNPSAGVRVYIMGHSLGKSDKGILKDIFDKENKFVRQIVIFYRKEDYAMLIIHLVEMFGQNFVIEQTGNGRIIFERLYNGNLWRSEDDAITEPAESSPFEGKVICGRCGNECKRKIYTYPDETAVAKWYCDGANQVVDEKIMCNNPVLFREQHLIKLFFRKWNSIVRQYDTRYKAEWTERIANGEYRLQGLINAAEQGKITKAEVTEDLVNKVLEKITIRYSGIEIQFIDGTEF